MAQCRAPRPASSSSSATARPACAAPACSTPAPRSLRSRAPVARIDVRRRQPGGRQPGQLSAGRQPASPPGADDRRLRLDAGRRRRHRHRFQRARPTRRPRPCCRSGAGSFTVRLTVTDSLGQTSQIDRGVAVAAVPVVVTPPASGAAAARWRRRWIVGLLLATAALTLPVRGGRRDLASAATRRRDNPGSVHRSPHVSLAAPAALVQRWRCCSVAIVAAAGIAGQARAAGSARSPAEGLVVRLKDAARQRQRPGRQRAPGRAATPPRWRRVLGAAALTGASGQQRADAARRRSRPAAGSISAARWTADEADRMARSAARPARGRLGRAEPPRTAAAGCRPIRWCRSNGGCSRRAAATRRVADRLRGVPGFITAWQSGIAGARGGPAAVVAVLDTGITAHPDLAGRLLPGYDFVSDPTFANDGDGRDADPSDPGDWVSARRPRRPALPGLRRAGQHLARHDHRRHGRGASPTTAWVWPAPTSTAACCRCGSPASAARRSSTSSTRMRWAGGTGRSPACRPTRTRRASSTSASAARPPAAATYQDAIDEVRAAKGAVVVAAAGNDHGAPTRPASCTRRRRRRRAATATASRPTIRTSARHWPTAASRPSAATTTGPAPGRALLRRQRHRHASGTTAAAAPAPRGYAALFGTSFAAPLVAATMSLMLSVNPALTQRQLIDGCG